MKAHRSLSNRELAKLLGTARRLLEPRMKDYDTGKGCTIAISKYIAVAVILTLPIMLTCTSLSLISLAHPDRRTNIGSTLPRIITVVTACFTAHYKFSYLTSTARQALNALNASSTLSMPITAL